MDIERVTLLSDTSHKILPADNTSILNSRFTLHFSMDEQKNNGFIDFVVRATMSILSDIDSEEQGFFSTTCDYGVKFADEHIESGSQIVVPVWPVIRESILAKCHEYDVNTPPLPFVADTSSFQKP
ncbi:hypothetical protein [Alloscardovia sp. HMSC034E08]|uniref:hypothetical protein n=1 Tax=Alloscardovia sp. HMSC034E08 TaxID=1739413 RepID=UPI0008D7ABAE|nr:hypothetical protein [Alloscardovia sp. HMSC034E08]OFQ96672.1 hypothetical protein HMPREF2909_00455 [Alloscardovia sp. HMSC034E08]